MRELDRLFEKLPQAIVVINPDSHCVEMCSPSVQAILGISPGDLTGQTTQALYRDEIEYHEFCLWSKTALDANHLFRRTCRMTRGDGRAIDAVQTVLPLDDSDDPTLLVVIVEEQAKPTAEPGATAVDPAADTLDLKNLSAMLYRTFNSHDWKLAFVSEGARYVTGYAPGAFMQPDYAFYQEIIRESDRESVLNHIRDSVAETGQFDVRYQIKDAAGDLRWVDHQGVTVRSSDGNEEWIEGMIVDITRDRHLRDTMVVHRRHMRSLLYHTLQSMERVREGVADRIQRSIAGHLLSSTAAIHSVAGKIRKKNLVEDLQSIQTSLETAIEDCNAMAGEMTPSVLDRLGLNGALDHLLRDFRSRRDVQTSLKWAGSTARLDRGLEKFLYRSTEELVHNVFEHAGVTEARVSVRVQDDSIRVAVKDFGKGFSGSDLAPDDKGRRGTGLFLIQECAAHLGGECAIATKRGTGSRVTVEIPLPLSAANSTAQDADTPVNIVDESIELHEL